MKKSDIRFLITAAIAVILYVFARTEAVIWRGNDAVGGEILLLVLPFFVEPAVRTIKGLWNAWKENQ